MPLSMEEFHLATKSMAKNKSLNQDGVMVRFHLFFVFVGDNRVNFNR